MNRNITSRPTVTAVEGLMDVTLNALDHGFVRVVDYMGDDNAVVQAARVSYGKGTKTYSEDRGLIRYLMRKWHTTPFEMCEIKLHVKMPIFVARQWVRHRTASINEYSARYSILDKEFYFPSPEQVEAQSTTNKQGRDGELPPELVRAWLEESVRLADDAYANYEQAADDKIARELARMGLPLNTYTQWYWKVDLHNLLHFLRLRADPHAQQEIREYADIILHAIVRQWVPLTYEAFCDYRLNAETFSSQEMELIRLLVREATRAWRGYANITEEDLRGTLDHVIGHVLNGQPMSGREKAELIEKLVKS